MSDTPNSNPFPENDSELVKKPDGTTDEPLPVNEEDFTSEELDDLFGDLETPEDILYERDELRQKVADAEAGMRRMERDNDGLRAQIEQQRSVTKGETDKIERTFETERIAIVKKFIVEAMPVTDELAADLASVPKEQRASDNRLDKITQGMEKILGQLQAVFAKHAAKQPPQEAAAEEVKEDVVKTEEVTPKAAAPAADETPEAIQAERDALRKQMIEHGSTLTKLRTETVRLANLATKQKDEAAQIVARVQKQTDGQKDFMLEKFLKEMLPSVDNLERGLEVLKPELRAKDAQYDLLAKNIEKSIAGLTTVFNKFGITIEDPMGQDFDDSKHYAVDTKTDGDAEFDTVVEVTGKGYVLNGRVVRLAQVIVQR